MKKDIKKINIEVSVVEKKDDITNFLDYEVDELIYIKNENLLTIIRKDEQTGNKYILPFRKTDNISLIYVGLNAIINKLIKATEEELAK